MALCVHCQFGEFCFGKDCKCPDGHCDHNPNRRERLLVKAMDQAIAHKEAIRAKHGKATGQ